MKHLKLFENQNDTVWVAVILPIYSTTDYLVNNTEPQVFETKEDMENFLLDFINSELSMIVKDRDMSEYQNYELDEDGHYFFTEYESAMNWVRNGESEYQIMKFEREIIKNVKVPENVRIYRDAKKYNL